MTNAASVSDENRRDARRSLRVLWILSVDPARSTDGQLTYSLGLIEGVAAAGAEVTVVHLGSRAPATCGPRRIVWRATGSTNRNRLRSVFSRLPAMAYTAGSPPFVHAVLDELDHHWDAVVVDHVQSGWVMDTLAERLDRGTVVAHVSHNDEQTVRRRVASGTATRPGSRLVLEFDARKVAALEHRTITGADLVTTITEDDAAAFATRGTGIDAVVLTPGYSGARIARREITADVPRRAVIAGSMLWRVKQFDLLALLRVADARFAAAGAEIVVLGEAPPDFRAEVLGATVATRMLGRVDSFEDEFSQARLALLSEPHGGGFKLKTLDYVFQRLPMLVQRGSVSGLPLGDDKGLLEFTTVEGLVDGALGVLDDLETLNRLQNDAYEICEDAFDWATPSERFLGAITKAAARKH